MKKITITAILILILTLAFAVCSMAASPVSISTAVTYAQGGCYAMVYAKDASNSSSYFVYTVNGVDSDPTTSSEYKALVGFGVNEIYVTAYDSSDEILGVSDTIEVIGNDYEAFKTAKLYDFESSASSPSPRIDGKTGDKTKVLSEIVDISDTFPEYGSAGHLKSQNPTTESNPYRADYYYSRNWFKSAYAAGDDTFIYEVDILPVKLDKDVDNLMHLRYNNDTRSFLPFIFKTDLTVSVATSIEPGFTGSATSPVFDIELGEWINFRIIMDSANEVIILMADDVAYSTVGFKSTADDKRYFNMQSTVEATYIMLQVGVSGLSDTSYLEFYVDNLGYLTSNYLERYEFDAYAKKGDEDADLSQFPIEGGSITLEFSTDMAQITKEDIIFEANGEKKAFDIVFDADSDTLTIIPSNPFLGREKCRITLENVRAADGAVALYDNFLDFTVGLPYCAIVSCEGGPITAGSTVTFDVSVRNSLSRDADGIVIIGVYKNNGLERVGTAPLLCPALSQEDAKTQVSVIIPDDYNDEEYEIYADYVRKNSLYVIDYIKIQP